MAKGCPQHGYVLKDRGAIDEQRGQYCPQCGNDLRSDKVFWLDHLGKLISKVVLFFLCPTRTQILALCLIVMAIFCVPPSYQGISGCIRERRISRAETIKTMSEEWQRIYTAVQGGGDPTLRYRIFERYFRDNPNVKLPVLKPKQVDLFLKSMSWNVSEAFALIGKHSDGDVWEKQ